MGSFVSGRSGATSTSREGGRGRPDREHVAGPQRGRAETGEHVGGARPEDGGDVDATAHGQVAAQPGGRHAEAQDVAGVQHERGQVGDPRSARPGQVPAPR